MNKILTIMLMIVLSASVFAQEAKKGLDKEFTPSGKPFVKVFANYHNISKDGKGDAAFEIQRAYLGYSYKMSKAFSGKVTLDVGNPEDDGKLEMTAYLKNAYMQYKDYGFTAKFGLIGTSQFNVQEKNWSGRYFYKSFQDQYKFGPSADQGLYLAYKIHKMISVDASILNGEGYKKVGADNIMKYTAGLTLAPLDGLTLRAYYDELGNAIKQKSMAFFAGYKYDAFKLGAEYNLQSNNKNKDGNDISGMSFYSGYKTSYARFFARFDQLASKDDWNTVIKATEKDEEDKAGKDGAAILIGAEFSPVKGIKITPHYNGWTPKASIGKVSHGVYLSFEIKY